MDIKVLVGRKAIHKVFGAGEVVEVVRDNIFVVFNDVRKQFPLKSLGEFFRFEDDETRELVQKLTEAAEASKKAAAAAKKAAEEAARKAEADRKAAEESARMAEAKEKKDKRNRPIHPYIDERRSNGKHAIFLVCQNNNYQIESENGFIWAPAHRLGVTDHASHAEMDLVKKGDIIFHHFNNTLHAVSVAQTDCTLQAAAAGHPNAGEVGRYVELSYHILETPTSTRGMKLEKAKYGSMKYGPFDKNGDNKRGFYLSELDDHLATIFIDATIKANPGDPTLLTIKSEI